MTTRNAALLSAGLSAGAMLALAQPAFAQVQLPEMEAETVFVEEAVVQPYGAATNRYQQAPQDERWVRSSDYAETATAAPRLGYSNADREAWLADCTILLSERPSYIDDYYDNDADGGLIGGLLGLIVGGVAGNRIADGDRLAGTLLGGGIGAVAGAVLGNVLDGEDDDIEEVAFDPYAAEYCAAYLRRYEAQGAGAFAGHGHQHSHQHGAYSHTVSTAQQAPSRRRVCRPCGEEVIEEVVVEEPRAIRAIPRRAQPAPTGSKLIPIK